MEEECEKTPEPPMKDINKALDEVESASEWVKNARIDSSHFSLLVKMDDLRERAKRLHKSNRRVQEENEALFLKDCDDTQREAYHREKHERLCEQSKNMRKQDGHIQNQIQILKMRETFNSEEIAKIKGQDSLIPGQSAILDSLQDKLVSENKHLRARRRELQSLSRYILVGRKKNMEDQYENLRKGVRLLKGQALALERAIERDTAPNPKNRGTVDAGKNADEDSDWESDAGVD